ncbi:hypothetical protein ACFX11_042662 [Malus domestica]
MSNRTTDMSPAILKSCFIGGLKAELRHNVKLLKPRNVLEAASFAQQVDAKLSDLKVKSFHRAPTFQPTFRSPTSLNVMHPTTLEIRPKNPSVRRLTPEEVDHCRKNGLCFHCKEKYGRGHMCEKKQLLLIDVQDFDNFEKEENDIVETEEPEITACALFGTPAPPTINTMRVQGFIKNCPVTILIDSGSSHNFIDLSLVKRMKYTLDTGHIFNVKIADGGRVATKRVLNQVSVKIQQFSCVIDLYAMPFGGCDIVLGVQWLRTLGPILWCLYHT